MNIVTGCSCSQCGTTRLKAPGPCSVCGDTRRTFNAEINESIGVTATLTTGIRRGEQSWAYFYMVAALLVGIALAVISVFDAPGWARAIAMLCVAIIIIVAIADCAAIHNLLLRIKSAYEDRIR